MVVLVLVDMLKLSISVTENQHKFRMKMTLQETYFSLENGSGETIEIEPNVAENSALPAHSALACLLLANFF